MILNRPVAKKKKNQPKNKHDSVDTPPSYHVPY